MEKFILYQDKFDEAASILEPLVGLYTLAPDLQNVFLTSGENGSESVFEVQHSKNSNWWDWGFPQGSEGSFGLFTTELEDTMVPFMLKDGVLMFQLKIYTMHMLLEILEEM